VNVNITTCTFREIYNVEFYEARNRLGYDFWQAMITALADYSAEPEYVAGTSYTADDIVKYQGVYKIALVDTDAVPSVSTDWGNAPRFTGSCADTYESLFCDFLAPYLANKVLADRLPYIWTQIRDTGVVQINGQQLDSVSSDDYTRLQRAIHSNANRAWGNLKWFMAQDTSEENACFAEWPGYETQGCGCGESSCRVCNTDRKRVGGYSFG